MVIMYKIYNESRPTTEVAICLLHRDPHFLISNPFVPEKNLFFYSGCSICETSCKSCSEWTELKTRPRRSSGQEDPCVIHTFTIPREAFDCYANAFTFHSSTPPSVKASDFWRIHRPEAERFSTRLSPPLSPFGDGSQTAATSALTLIILFFEQRVWLLQLASVPSWMRSWGIIDLNPSILEVVWAAADRFYLN